MGVALRPFQNIQVYFAIKVIYLQNCILDRFVLINWLIFTLVKDINKKFKTIYQKKNIA